MSDSAARGDFDAAFKIAHHIKGTASQIEAKTLFACASGAEAKWRRGEAVDAAQLEALTSSLNKLLAEIDRYQARRDDDGIFAVPRRSSQRPTFGQAHALMGLSAAEF